jgi:hypothetical protein
LFIERACRSRVSASILGAKPPRCWRTPSLLAASKTGAKNVVGREGLVRIGRIFGLDASWARKSPSAAERNMGPVQRLRSYEQRTKLIEAGLLNSHRRCGRLQRFVLQRAVHPLVAAILLGVSWLYAFVTDAELQPPDGQSREPARSTGRVHRFSAKMNTRVAICVFGETRWFECGGTRRETSLSQILEVRARSTHAESMLRRCGSSPKGDFLDRADNVLCFGLPGVGLFPIRSVLICS